MKKTLKIIAFIFCILAVLIGINWLTHNDYKKVTTANNGTQLAKQVQRYDNKGTTYYVFVYRHNCGDCTKIAKKIMPILTKQHNKDRLIAFDTFHYQRHGFTTYLEEHNIDYVPTMLKVKDGKTTAKYSGTSISKFNQLTREQ